MPKNAAAALKAARSVLQKPTGLDSLLEKVRLKDRAHIERHLTACDAEGDPRHGQVWRRMACSLGTLAPLAIQMVGEGAMQFFVADGKYRMQAFALEDVRDGAVHVYLPDTLAEAQKMGVLLPPPRGAATTDEEGPREYGLAGKKGGTLLIESLSATNSPNPPAHMKNMLGWNRKALRVSLPNAATDAQIEATEDFCALAAQKWVASAAKTESA